MESPTRTFLPGPAGTRSAITRSDIQRLFVQSMLFSCVAPAIRSPRSGVDEAVVLAIPEDHMVEDADAEELSSVTKALRELDILGAR